MAGNKRMNKEKVIEELEILKENCWDDDGYGHETKQYEDTMLALDVAIETIKQESILDKIRAELHTTAEMHEDGDYYLREEWIDKIFDKYAESEE